MDVGPAAGGLGDGGGGEEGGVQAVAGVGEGGVPVRLGRGGGRVAGVGPAVDVGPDEGADPFAEGVVVGGGGRGLEPEQQVPVREALGGEGPAGGELVEPEAGDVGGAEAPAVPAQQDQVQQG